MRACGSRMVFCPPLVISRAEVDEMVEKARACFDLTYEEVMGETLSCASVG